MYINASKHIASCTRVSSYVVWRVQLRRWRRANGQIFYICEFGKYKRDRPEEPRLLVRCCSSLQPPQARWKSWLPSQITQNVMGRHQEGCCKVLRSFSNYEGLGWVGRTDNNLIIYIYVGFVSSNERWNLYLQALLAFAKDVSMFRHILPAHGQVQGEGGRWRGFFNLPCLALAIHPLRVRSV